MIEQILNNLPFLSEEDKTYIATLMENNADIGIVFYTAINYLLSKWHEKYPMFKIPSGIISIRVDDQELFLPFGNAKYSKDTVFDIASMSKVYTEMILFSILDEKGLSLDTKVKDLVDFYGEDIGELTLMDLISFNNDYRTKIDIRNCTNKEDAIKALRTSYLEPSGKGLYKYTDLPIMILTDILETITGMDYKELFNKYIVERYDLRDTYLDINRDDYVSINKNMTNDPKANIMGGYYGHCGVKTTSQDFLEFFSQVLNSKYKSLFVSRSKTLTSDRKPREDKALVGNMSLPIEGGGGLASPYVTGEGFAIQGSVRSHGETNNFVIDGEEHRVTSSIFMDLYTQYDAMKEFERVTGKSYTREYEVDGHGKLIMSDVRDVMKYTADYKELTKIMGACRTLALYKVLSMKQKDGRNI
jgi:CubicO group peptidase (beta-lactamase class C family)